MSGDAVTALIAALAALVSAVATKGVSAVLDRRRTAAEVSAAAAETEARHVDAQSKIISDLIRHTNDLDRRLRAGEGRLARTEGRLADVEAADRRKAELISRMSRWQRAAYRIMSEDQRAEIGEPPLVDEGTKPAVVLPPESTAVITTAREDPSV